MNCHVGCCPCARGRRSQWAHQVAGRRSGGLYAASLKDDDDEHVRGKELEMTKVAGRSKCETQSGGQKSHFDPDVCAKQWHSLAILDTRLWED